MCGSEVGEGGVASLAVRAATPELFVGEGAEPAWSVRLHSSQRDAQDGLLRRSLCGELKSLIVKPGLDSNSKQSSLALPPQD